LDFNQSDIPTAIRLTAIYKKGKFLPFFLVFFQNFFIIQMTFCLVPYGFWHLLTGCRHYAMTLKVPKREIFVTELFTLSDPIWIGDMRIEPKKLFVLSVRLIFAILFL
jgi:hypothetical protein